jgi:membrane protease YdiL (CAAX protease family)
MTHALTHRDRLPRRLAPFLVYVLVFHVLWIGWAYGIYPWLTTLGETTLQYALVNLSLRLLIWVVPVVVYLHRIDHVDPLTYLKLKHHWQRGLLMGLAVTALNLLLSLVRFGVPQPTLQSVTWNSLLGTSFLIGVVEEIPYRGFMLQKFQERLPFWAANLLTSLLFVSIHLPGWLALHLLRVETVTFVFGFSIIMGVVFRLAQSLWSVIVAHSLNDFLTVVLFGR